MARKHTLPVSYLTSRSNRVSVVPCTTYAGCFRWIVSSTDGLFSEQSAYPYATRAGAEIVGRIRMADLSAIRPEMDRT